MQIIEAEVFDQEFVRLRELGWKAYYENERDLANAYWKAAARVLGMEVHS